VFQENSVLFIFARALMGLLLFVTGIGMLIGFTETVSYFSNLGFPLPQLVAALTITIKVGASVLLVVGWRTPWIAGFLGIFTLVAALIGHQFWVADAAQYTSQLNNFFKNISMVGGFLLLMIPQKKGLITEH